MQKNFIKKIISLFIDLSSDRSGGDTDIVLIVIVVMPLVLSLHNPDKDNHDDDNTNENHIINDSVTLESPNRPDSPSLSIIARDTLHSSDLNPRSPQIDKLDFDDLNKFLDNNTNTNTNIDTNNGFKSLFSAEVNPININNNTTVGPAAAIDSDDQNAEYEELNKELTRKGKEYKQLLKENQQIYDKTLQKETLLVTQEQYLSILKEKNAATIVQDELEANISIEYMDFELSVKETKVKDLKYQNDIIQNMEQENIVMENQIKEILQNFEKSGMEYSAEIHRMNKELLEYRVSLEATMRKEFQIITHKHESDAFDQLSEYDKSSLLSYSKLQDDLALQSIGIQVLTNRKYNTDMIKAELSRLQGQATNLRDVLGIIAKEKTLLSSQLQTLNETETQLKTEKETLGSELYNEPLISQLEIKIECIKADITEELKVIEAWKKLLQSLNNINAYIKPTSDLEKRGYFSQEPFRSAGKVTTLKMEEMEQAIKSDKSNMLKEALMPLIGQEGKLVDTVKSPLGDICQNMPVLVAAEIIRVFKEAELEIDNIKKRDEINIPIESIQIEEQPYTGSFFTTDHVEDLDENPWYKPQTSPKRVPDPNYETLIPPNLITDNDTIQQFRYDFSLSPPITISRNDSKEKTLKSSASTATLEEGYLTDYTISGPKNSTNKFLNKTTDSTSGDILTTKKMIRPYRMPRSESENQIKSKLPPKLLHEMNKLTRIRTLNNSKSEGLLPLINNSSHI